MATATLTPLVDKISTGLAGYWVRLVDNRKHQPALGGHSLMRRSKAARHTSVPDIDAILAVKQERGSLPRALRRTVDRFLRRSYRQDDTPVLEARRRLWGLSPEVLPGAKMNSAVCYFCRQPLLSHQGEGYSECPKPALFRVPEKAS